MCLTCPRPIVGGGMGEEDLFVIGVVSRRALSSCAALRYSVYDTAVKEREDDKEGLLAAGRWLRK